MGALVCWFGSHDIHSETTFHVRSRAATFQMFMCGDPKGKIPAWLINSAMPTLAVKGVVSLREKALEVQANMAKRREMVKRLSIEGKKLYLEGVKPTPTKKK